MMVGRLREALQQSLAPANLDIRDDSAAHAGHAGAREGAHLAITIVAEGFSGRSLIERHRMVYEAAAPLLAQGIHALQIHALTPAEAAARSSQRSS
ncbi:MAG: BolA family transcriptional regulator [Proteobacteria bacterium]|jgi:BolA protein|nr:BolA family transcriptional regulator [Pseudomonadota bacterium]